MKVIEIIKEACNKTNGKKWDIWKPFLVVMVITSILSSIITSILGNNDIAEIVDSIFSILVIPLQIGLITYVLNFIRGKDYSLDTLKEAYSDGNKIGKYIGYSILTGLVIGLFAIPLIAFVSYFMVKGIDVTAITKATTPEQVKAAITLTSKDFAILGVGSLIGMIPVIYASMAFGLSNYILADSTDYGIKEFIKKNFELTNGYKFKFFLLSLVYVVLACACILVVPIIWVIPIILVSEALFYEHVKNAKK